LGQSINEIAEACNRDRIILTGRYLIGRAGLWDKVHRLDVEDELRAVGLGGCLKPDWRLAAQRFFDDG
jgi:hypothetical protein